MTSVAQAKRAFNWAAFPMTIGALACGFAGTVLGTFLTALHIQGGDLCFFWAAPAIAAAAMTALLERGTKNAFRCFRVTVAVLIAIQYVYLSFYVSRASIWNTVFALTFLVPSFLAWLLLRKGFSASKCLMVVWLTSFAIIASLTTVPMLAVYGLSELGREALFFAFGYPFGPWATLAMRLVSFPNAGEGFSLPLALLLTAALGPVVYLILSKLLKAAYWLIPFTWLLVGWFVCAQFQIISCLDKHY